MKTVIVTGCNKGVGFGIVKALAATGAWRVIMACRNVPLANQAMTAIKGLHPGADLVVEQLDLSVKESVDKFRDVIRDKYGRVSALVNNAGVAVKGKSFDIEGISWTFNTNYFGTVYFTEQMTTLIEDRGKVIFVGSSAGKISIIRNEQIRNRLKKEDLKKEQLDFLLNLFLTAVKQNNYKEKGWPQHGYGMSKVGINTFARVYSNYPEVKERQIQSYTCCPGYVATDMSSFMGPLTIEQGAITPVFLLNLPFEVNPDWQGKYFSQSKLSPLW